MLEPNDDLKLVASALKGKDKAWAALVRRYEQRVYNYCFRIGGNREDALDMMQDVFMAVYRNLGSFRGDGTFAAWLFRIASFRGTDFLRRRRPGAVATDDFDHVEGAESERPEQQTIGSELTREILRLMASLPREQRLVVELKFFQHFTFEEISSQLGIPTNTAKTRLYTALRKMKRHEETHRAM